MRHDVYYYPSFSLKITLEQHINSGTPRKRVFAVWSDLFEKINACLHDHKFFLNYRYDGGKSGNKRFTPSKQPVPYSFVRCGDFSNPEVGRPKIEGALEWSCVFELMLQGGGIKLSSFPSVVRYAETIEKMLTVRCPEARFVELRACLNQDIVSREKHPVPGDIVRRVSMPAQCYYFQKRNDEQFFLVSLDRFGLGVRGAHAPPDQIKAAYSEDFVPVEHIPGGLTREEYAKLISGEEIGERENLLAPWRTVRFPQQ